jgi:hypothetical protein
LCVWFNVIYVAFSTRDATSGAVEDAELVVVEPDATEEAGAEPTSP